MTAKTPVKGHTSKHVHKASKHHKAKGKHHPSHVTNPVPSFKVVPPHVIGKPATHPKPRGLALDGLPVCAFEAVAQSLRLAGAAVSEDDMLGLWHLAGEREVSIAEALAAAARFGLAGCRPGFAPVVPVGSVGIGGPELIDRQIPGPVLAGLPALPFPLGRVELPAGAVRRIPDGVVSAHALILGVDMPGPHAVLATPDGWWSWGELHSPWTRAVSEAWAVSWS